jgi:hypothetical protein
MFGGDFVSSITHEFVRQCKIPMLVMPGDDLPHPKAIGEEIAGTEVRLDKRRASFETAAARLPQDEALFAMPLEVSLMLRSAKGASRSTHDPSAAIR